MPRNEIFGRENPAWKCLNRWAFAVDVAVTLVCRRSCSPMRFVRQNRNFLFLFWFFLLSSRGPRANLSRYIELRAPSSCGCGRRTEGVCLSRYRGGGIYVDQYYDREYYRWTFARWPGYNARGAPAEVGGVVSPWSKAMCGSLLCGVLWMHAIARRHRHRPHSDQRYAL